jgi:hypothetical protein
MHDAMCAADAPTPGTMPVFNEGIQGMPTK